MNWYELFERCRRFESLVGNGSGYHYVPNKLGCLIFKIDKDISLPGVTLFGNKNCDYSVDIKIQLINDFFSLHQNEKIFFSVY